MGVGCLLVYSPFVIGLQAAVSLLRGELLPNSVRASASAPLFVIFFLGLFTSTQVVICQYTVIYRAKLYQLVTLIDLGQVSNDTLH